MFIGHLGVAFGARAAEPRLRLGTAFVAAQLPDAIWPVLVLAGVERFAIAPGDTVVTPLRFEHYPWSHSLSMVVVAGLAFGLAAAERRSRLRQGLLLAALAASHFVLDWITHRPDLPLVPGAEAVYGLGLWNSLWATLVVELALFAAGVACYLRGAARRGPALALAATLLVVHLGNLFGPPPPSTTAVTFSALLLIPLLWWWGNRVDRAARAGR
ncbi:MAG: hypothetical protein NDJ94_06695 [Vicinamibacteria bacterium]|nr:hypothetical protein [Vicinamibacteria bacterium]